MVVAGAVFQDARTGRCGRPGGQVRLDGKRVKAARAVRAGDRLKITRPGAELEVTVLNLPARRGPASEAVSCYRIDSQLQTPGSPVPRRGQDGPPGRPDKHARKALRRLRGR